VGRTRVEENGLRGEKQGMERFGGRGKPRIGEGKKILMEPGLTKRSFDQGKESRRKR